MRLNKILVGISIFKYFKNKLSKKLYRSKKIMASVEKIESTEPKEIIIRTIKHKKYNTIDF